MAGGNVGLTMHVQWRDPLGRFAAQVEEGATLAADDIAKEGARLSARYAPKGRTRRLAGAIKAVKGVAGQARWFVEGGDKLLTIAASQESGSRAHIIESRDGGPLANKERPGVNGRKGFYAKSGRVRHPGTDAIHFMQRARREMAARAVVMTGRRMPKRRGT